ncbi:hypothetical protein KP509_22G061500 [Ceratopteris richardii]|uniref:RING-type E3 ubiquitin transferase n=1 Tax=Ceratopteris richardii TaxID=49495 RepID=A0A8T2S7M3_CERRI|nr:hypothetical protein KP509_22G061500 [Ceratopteris richardii]
MSLTQSSAPLNGFPGKEAIPHYTSDFITAILIPVIAVVTFVTFVVALLHVFARWRSNDRYGSIFISRRVIRSVPSHSTIDGPRAAGLNSRAIAQLPTLTFKGASIDTLVHEDDADNPSLVSCAICLGEYELDQKVRVLPACKHSFHTECIDPWFQSHSTCPLCRKQVLGTSPVSDVGYPEIRVPIFEGMQPTSVTASSATQLDACPEAATSASSRSLSTVRTRELPGMVTIQIPSPHGNAIVVVMQTPRGRLYASTRPEMAQSAHLLQPLRCPFTGFVAP